ncbi:hypothetical protein NDU88_003245 [Pleurodeles waltl]|uniref:Uncharacterized protein n=1 Tax=Pleurodeles waltl TaxID=8319 RepID=A0AAV7M4U0_PLEWA|nr:hypothetical protein NDU88_003245 [Pleurodeles waltl]
MLGDRPPKGEVRQISPSALGNVAARLRNGETLLLVECSEAVSKTQEGTASCCRSPRCLGGCRDRAIRDPAAPISTTLRLAAALRGRGQLQWQVERGVRSRPSVMEGRVDPPSCCGDLPL